MSANQIASPLISIAAAQDGSAVAVDDQGNVYQAVPGAIPWTQVTGGLTSISAASDGTVLGVNVTGVAGAVYQWNDGNFQTAYAGLPTTAQMADISVASSSEVWALDTGGNAYQYSSGTWATVGPPAMPTGAV
ncbi:MAG TPA: tectonin domain-containing protein, partial [Thermoanaerobaculia bacterium]